MIPILSVLSSILAILTDEEEFDSPYDLAREDPYAVIQFLMSQGRYDDAFSMLTTNKQKIDLVLNYINQYGPRSKDPEVYSFNDPIHKLIEAYSESESNPENIAEFTKAYVKKIQSCIPKKPIYYDKNMDVGLLKLLDGFLGMSGIDYLLQSFARYEIYIERPSLINIAKNYSYLAEKNKTRLKYIGNRECLQFVRNNKVIWTLKDPGIDFEHGKWPRIRAKMASDQAPGEQIYVQPWWSYGFGTKRFIGLRFFAIEEGKPHKTLILLCNFPENCDEYNMFGAADDRGYTYVPATIQAGSKKFWIYVNYIQPYLGKCSDTDIWHNHLPDKYKEIYYDPAKDRYRRVFDYKWIGIWRRACYIPVFKG